MPDGEVLTIDGALSALTTVPAWRLGDAALVAECEALFRLEQRLAAVRLDRLAELDTRELARDQGATSTIGWLRWRLRIPAATATRTLRLARRLAAHPPTRAALTAGTITVDQAHAITESLDALPEQLPPPQPTTSAENQAADPADSGPAGGRDGARSDTVAASDIVGGVERILLEHAAALAPADLRVAGRHALERIAPEVADELERVALERAEQRAFAKRRLDLYDDAAGGAELRGYLDGEGAAIVRTAITALSSPLGVGDERHAGQRRADALVDLCKRAMDTGTLPAQGSQPTQLVITTRLEPLVGALATRAGVGTGIDLGAGQLDTGERLSPAMIRRLACDAAILPAVLGGAGQVLDLGRSRRLFSGAIRRALDLRDGGCAFPGCDRAPIWCEAHHILTWLLGGETTVDNGVLVCRVHHRLLHEPDGWRVRLGADRLPEFIPPPWIDPERKPLRNARQRIRPP